ncbi:MAG: YdeI/OmpD-associated family protein [Candidatus Saccharimonadaceae bacterium]
MSILTKTVLGGTIHKLPADLKKALLANPKALTKWSDITPLARNEWICWVEGAKLIETRARRVERTHTELVEGVRRPCCWPGCIHRERNGKA